MSILTERSPTGRRTAHPAKSSLFCPTCDRVAPIADWPVYTAMGVETVVCPDCGELLAVTQYAPPIPAVV